MERSPHSDSEKPHSLGKSSRLGSGGGGERGKLFKQLLHCRRVTSDAGRERVLEHQAPLDVPFPVEDLGYTLKVYWLICF